MANLQAHSPLPLILTMGDATGIGPEVLVKALHQLYFNRLVDDPTNALLILGSAQLLKKTAEQLDLPDPASYPQVLVQTIHTEQEGETAYQCAKEAVRLLSLGQAAALVTGPISKASLHDSGRYYTGQTELLEDLANHYYPQAITPWQAEMLFVAEQLRLMLLTRHVPLAQVPEALRCKDITRAFQTLEQCLKVNAEVNYPKVAVLGVNPHAGEMGGDEERFCLQPAMERLNHVGQSHWVGPFAADAFFRDLQADNPGYDAIISAYHDQGLIPFKLLARYQSVNVTIGLPFLRTAVSHGTAPELVGKNLARPDSLCAAIMLAQSWTGPCSSNSTQEGRLQEEAFAGVS